VQRLEKRVFEHLENERKYSILSDVFGPNVVRHKQLISDRVVLKRIKGQMSARQDLKRVFTRLHFTDSKSVFCCKFQNLKFGYLTGNYL
jgi:hypothetical protein